MMDKFRFFSLFLILFLSLSDESGGGPKKTPQKEPPLVPPPPVIVIDPGHGGKDPGAISKKKVREKDVVLSISKKVASTLRSRIEAKVQLTRSGDRFISLGQRDLIANSAPCDLFLSIHANASKNSKAEGLEIYYLNKATDEASRRLAARENAGASKKEEVSEAILSDLIQTASTEESADLARKVKKGMERQLREKYNLPQVRIKAALFYILVGAKCPSLLIETGFITNPREGKRLREGRFQTDIANAIAAGVKDFLESLDRPGSDL